MTPGESHKAEELSRDEIFLNKIRDYVIRNISSEAFSLEALVLELGYSRSQVHKKLKKITGKSLSAFVREIRLEEALKLLRAKAGTASEIAYRTGFSSPAYFSQCFNNYFGFTPGEAVKKEVQKPDSLKPGSKHGSFSKPIKWKLRLAIVILAVLLIAVIILAYPKIFNRAKSGQLGAEGKTTVAVMPFQNMTNDTTKNYCEKGIQILMANSLSNNNGILVRQSDIINGMLEGRGITDYASLTPSIASLISRKLDADIFITGNIMPKGTSLRITAQLMNSRTKEIIKPFQIEGPRAEENIIIMTDSLSEMVNNYLVISVLEKELNELDAYLKFSSTSSREALRKYILGVNAHYRGDELIARDCYLDALKIDSNFFAASWGLVWVYNNLRIYDQAKKTCLKLYAIRNEVNRYQEDQINWAYAWFFETPREVINAVRQLHEIDNQVPESYRIHGNSYERLHEYEKAIPEYEKALDIYKKWDLKPERIFYYTDLGRAYHKTGQYRKERKLYRKAVKDFPDDYLLPYYQAILELSEGKTKAANEYIEKYISVNKERSLSEADIAINLGRIYWNAELFDKAEDYLREALRLRPESPATMNVIAFFLIDTERNITEGLEIIDKALELSPDHYEYLDTKGWGLYKQGKYQEALDILQKSWDLRMENAVYWHGGFLHLEAAKKAVAVGNTEY
ncbi:MAG: tetratricopeptide repeat protein [Bacteroidota bacterium]